MDSLKKVFQAVGCAWLIIVAVIGIGGTWLTYNMGEVTETGGKAVAEAIYDASGEKDRQCQIAEARYNEAWEDAVNTNRIEQRQSQLDRLKAEVDRNCQSR